MLFIEGYYILHRTLAIPLHRAVLLGEPVLLQGPRGAGKTTLVQREFPAHTYVTLDNAIDRSRARSDPRGFLAKLRGSTVIDDFHRAPELLPHLEEPRPLILVSCRRLAVPFETFALYPPTQAEREARQPLSMEILGRFAASAPAAFSAPLSDERSWIERDVRELIQVRDLDRFELFLGVAESRSGAVLDMQAIANECGLSHRTVERWVGVLDACFQTMRLPASSLDFNRRLIQSPKLHFLNSESFESRAVSEIYRNARHSGLAPDLSYWRDSNGFEIPLIIQTGVAPPMPVMIVAEPNPTDVAKLNRWMELAEVRQGAIIAQRAGKLPRKGIVSYSIGQL